MDYYYTIDASGNLCHWGTKGMKWGRRLYQNKDGSLTPLGKKRYAKEEADLKAREKFVKNREREAAKRAKLDAKKAELDAREKALNGGSGKKGEGNAKADAAPKKKSLSEMSDVELNEAIERARLEDTYRSLRPEPVAKSSFGKEVLTDVVKPALMNSGRKALEAVIDKSVKDLLKDKVDPNSLAGIEAANKKLAAQLRNKLLKEGIDIDVKGENVKAWQQFVNDRNAAKKAEEDAKAAKAQEKVDAKAAKAQAKADAKAAKKAEAEAEEQARIDAKERQDEYYRVKAQRTQEYHDRVAAENQREYYEYKDSVRQEAADRYGKRKQEEYKARKAEAKAKTGPKITVEDGPSRTNKSHSDDTSRRDPVIIDADISSDKQMVRYNSNTGLSVISNAHSTSGKQYVEGFNWNDLHYSNKSGSSSPSKSGDSDYDVESLIRRNGETLDDWYGRMKRSGLI